MKTNACRYVLLSTAVLAVAGTVAAGEPERPVAVNVEGLPSHVRARILDKAAQGQTALIAYLRRTQTVHQLRPEFVIKAPTPPPSKRRRQGRKSPEHDGGPAR